MKILHKETPVINRAEANELWCELFARKGIGWLPVLTGSMSPIILPGDQVLITLTRADQIRFGDIILFSRNGELVVHRVLKKWRGAQGVYFLEQGDTRHAFGVVSPGQAIGRVVIVKHGNRILDMTSSLSRIVSVTLTAWLYLASNTVQFLKRSRNLTLKKAGRVLSRSLLLLSNMLIRACFIVWYSSGLFVTKCRKAEQGNLTSVSNLREVKS